MAEPCVGCAEVAQRYGVDWCGQCERRDGKERRTGRIVNVMRTLPEWDRRKTERRDDD